MVEPGESRRDRWCGAQADHSAAGGLEEPALSDNAMRTLQARYLIKDSAGQAVERPGELFHRAARAVAAAEAQYGAAEDEVLQVERGFYHAMARGEFLPNSPTLMNAGRTIGMLSACFVLPIEDSIESIFESLKDAARIQKAGGGTGFSFDRLRPTGDLVASSGGRTSGPISFWRVFCEATRAIQQGAFRRGANMGMMSIDHPDVLKFITAKNDPQEFENFNISVKVTDAFMSALGRSGDEPHVVRNPRTGDEFLLPRGLDVQRYAIQDLVPAAGAAPRSDPEGTVGLITRREIWGMIVRSAWSTGEPGVCFIDRVNADNPTPALGRIEATNPCGEQPLLDYEACNLGSIDVSKCVRPGRLDEGAFAALVRLGVRFLDDVIDVNNHVVPQIEERCKGNRKIGLGIMGLADAMFELGIRYDSDEGLAFGRRIAELLAREAHAAGEALARRRGVFPNWRGSLWDTRHHRPMRNAAVTTIAPTGTLSILAGCSGGIEPAYALAFYRHVLDGQELLEVNGPFKRWAQRQGLWSDEVGAELASGRPVADLPRIGRKARELFVTAHDIAPAMHVRMQAAFQEHIDSAISKTINLPADASPADVEEVYRLAFDLRCKGVTVYRDGCRLGQPMAQGSPGAASQGRPRESAAGACPQCRHPLTDVIGCSRCPQCGSLLCSP